MRKKLSWLLVLGLLTLLSACGGGGGGGSSNPSATPSIIFTSKYGGTTNVVAQGVAIDSLGAIFLTGGFGPEVDFGGGVLASSGESVFIAKLDQYGDHVWSRAIGSGMFNRGIDIAVDGNADVIIIGSFSDSQINFGTPGDELNLQGMSDLFVVKLDGDTGSHIWSASFGSTGGGTLGISVTTDTNNDVVVTGTIGTPSIDFGGGNISNSGQFDIFLAKFSGTDGSHIFSAGYGDGNLQTPQDVITDSSNNIVLVGRHMGDVDFGGGVLAGESLFSDIFIAKFNSSGAHVFSQTFSGPTGSIDDAQSVDVDSSDNILIAGTFQDSINFGGSLLNASATNDIDNFVLKVNSSGAHLFSQSYGDFNSAGKIDLAVNNSNEIVVSGVFEGTINFGGGVLTSSGSTDVYVATLTNAGAHISSGSYGDSLGQNLSDLAVDGDLRNVLFGNFDGALNFGGGIVTSDGDDMYLASIDP